MKICKMCNTMNTDNVRKCAAKFCRAHRFFRPLTKEESAAWKKREQDTLDLIEELLAE